MFPQSGAGAVGGQLLPETQALLNRMSVRPSNVRIFSYNKLIRDLKAASLYTTSKISGLYILAAHDAQAARLNIIQNAINLSVTGTPTFTADRGYTGGASDGLTATGSANTTSHCAGFWINSYNASEGNINTGGTNGFLRSSSTQMTGRWGGNADGLETTTGAHSAMNTSDSGINLGFYKNGAPVSVESQNGLGGFGVGTIVVATGYGARHAAAHWGPGLSNGEVAALYAAMNTFLTAVGGA
jgi:hypothetical protein